MPVSKVYPYAQPIPHRIAREPSSTAPSARMFALGPRRPSSASARDGSYLVISCRGLGTTAGSDGQRPSGKWIAGLNLATRPLLPITPILGSKRGDARAAPSRRGPGFPMAGELPAHGWADPTRVTYDPPTAGLFIDRRVNYRGGPRPTETTLVFLGSHPARSRGGECLDIRFDHGHPCRSYTSNKLKGIFREQRRPL